MRVLCLSGYSHPSHHRKIELLANNPELEILHILQPGNGKDPGWYPSADGWRQYRVEVVPVRSLGRSGDPHRTIHWPPRFFIKEFKPDIIHCEHEQESLMALEVALARQLFAPKTPLLLYSWQNIVRRRSPSVSLVCSVTLHAAQHVVCASREAAEVLFQQGFQGSTSIAPLMGLDARYFFPKLVTKLCMQLGLSDFVVGYIGRLVADKGIDLLLRAVAEISRPIQILIVGQGPEKENLRLLANQLELIDRCHFVEEISYNLVPDYINALDVLVLPSRATSNWKEQFGRVLVEAMACKVVAVGADSGAIPEVIGDPRCIFPENDVKGLTCVLETILNDLELHLELREQGYQRVIQNYTVQQIAKNTQEVWDKLFREHSL